MENFEWNENPPEEQEEILVEQTPQELPTEEPVEEPVTEVVEPVEEMEATEEEIPSEEQPQMVFEVFQEEPLVVEESVLQLEKPAKKQKKGAFRWIVVALLVACLVLQVASMVGSAGAKQLESTYINDKGELIVTYSDGSSENLGVVVGKNGNDGVDGTTTIINGAEANAVGITQGLRSSVSIFCTFTQESRWGNFGGVGNATEYYSAGSGVIYQLNQAAGDAIIITNYHVVFDADSRAENGIAEKIQVYLYGSEINGMEMEATYVGGSMHYDLAVLQVKGSDVLKNSDAAPVSLGNSDLLQVGSTAIAIGNAEGSGISTTSGVVSIPSEYITMTASDGVTSVNYRVIRVDTAVNSGNSGGGLFDVDGKLIGIVNAKTIESGVENIGYALPVAVVEAVVNNILDYCLNQDNENVMRPILGVTVQVVASRAVYDSETGLLIIQDTVQVQSVEKGQLGKVFEVGDILVSATLNGVTKPLTRQHHLIDLLVTARVGDVVEFVVLRGGQEVTLSVTIDENCLTKY